MGHVLDNPAWNALISGNKHLSFGNDSVRYFDKEVSPFAAFKENTDESFLLLHKILPHSGPVLFVSPVEVKIPDAWKVLREIGGLQMVYDKEGPLSETSPEVVSLNGEHVTQMLALTQLTNPGPFASRTIAFGHYNGIFEDDKLVAMAGQRLHPFNYTEVSAVCTHPDYTGKGYARLLLLAQIARMKAASNVPFLHVRDSNERAIKVYEDLGFNTRTNVYFYFMIKA
ncbi:GNAT family N-acetyltransferase [Mucilaginibacter gotjawali]|uniref:Ribosomal-protein-alanine N-acetyltransferase n=2 Tax=Mucilaginibacter gotjawali TaxID=1550579 RepID=A0A110B0J5_9SPHI|nr:GNAT family N-acetyltransferase [Mucilaginibacter gotjawali]MBB3058541.1 ribosomal protein S18 acetylase RimI-like enzyme [Mucilaginibacter gotjawali]BAU55765.1 ribosomal-protein-alanine N-acetyltransferase [Mucilaginibacter gotjawali]